MNAKVLPPEILILIRDLDNRLTQIEERSNSEHLSTEKPKSHRRKSSEVSKGEVSSDSLPTGSD